MNVYKTAVHRAPQTQFTNVLHCGTVPRFAGLSEFSGNPNLFVPEGENTRSSTRGLQSGCVEPQPDKSALDTKRRTAGTESTSTLHVHHLFLQLR